MKLPLPRGPLSEGLFAAMRAGATGGLSDELLGDQSGDPTDRALSLWVLHELHYRGFEDVADSLEWDPGLLALRRELETAFETLLRERYAEHGGPGTAGLFADRLFDYVAAHDGRSIATHVRRRAKKDEVTQLLRERSIYHLKEADPTSWTLPRLGVATQAALVELQYDEYGAGDPNRLHAHLFARGLAAAGLDPTYGAYIDDAPLEVLEQNNAMTMFGLQRKLRGAALGHLAAFEATSSIPSRKMAQGLARLGFPQELVDYYDEHVTADAVHEQLAVRTICGSLLADEPELEDDVFFGAFTCLDLEDRFAARVLSRWEAAA